MFASCVFTTFFVCFAGGLAEMQVFPSKLRLSGTNQTVTLTCSIPSTATVQSVYAMTMSRNTSSQPSQEQVLALADAISPQSRLVSASEGGLPANSATVSGGTTQKSMQVILRQPDCKDAGVYRCVISYNNGTDAKPSAVDSSQNLTVTGKLIFFRLLLPVRNTYSNCLLSLRFDNLALNISDLSKRQR